MVEAQEPFFINCWTGIINGDYIDVEVGREGSMDDRQQGVIMVYNISAQQPSEIYRTPLRAGPMRIVAINGTRFTLAPIDVNYHETPGALQTPWTTQTPGPTFIFDIITRQWVGAAGTPLPSPSPSVLPFPTITASP
jgi:hypothetical protein